MNRIGFIISSISSLIGLILLYFTFLVEELVPIVGKMFSQLSMNRAYSESMYLADYTKNYITCICIILGGVVLTIIFYLKEEKK